MPLAENILGTNADGSKNEEYGNLRNYLWGLCIDHRFCRVIFPLFALEDVVEDIHYILNHKRQSYEIELPV